VSENAIQPVAVLRALGWIGEVLIFTNIGVSPRIVASISNALVLSNPNQTVGTVVEFGVSCSAFPVAIAVLDISDHPRLGQAGIVLQDLVIILTKGRSKRRGYQHRQDG